MKIKLKLQNLLLRPWRLTFIMIIFAFAFISGRLILFSLLGLILFIAACKIYFTEKKSYFGVIIPIIVLFTILGVYYIIDYNRVMNYLSEHSPLNFELVLDGTYTGEGQGLRGPIIITTKIEDGHIQNIVIDRHQEAITALKGLAEQFISQNRIDAKIVPATVHGAIEASEGFRDALNQALWKGVPEKPAFSKVTKILHYFSRFKIDMTTWNALAILFCITLVFDYTMQSVLIKNTGQVLTCYNCQTCVGACPVKIVDDEPYPMTMILAARLGDYEKVKYLSKYCVACSRCAGKCPVGNSGPSIAAAANIELINLRKRAKELSA